MIISFISCLIFKSLYRQQSQRPSNCTQLLTNNTGVSQQHNKRQLISTRCDLKSPRPYLLQERRSAPDLRPPGGGDDRSPSGRRRSVPLKTIKAEPLARQPIGMNNLGISVRDGGGEARGKRPGLARHLPARRGVSFVRG